MHKMDPKLKTLPSYDNKIWKIFYVIVVVFLRLRLCSCAVNWEIKRPVVFGGNVELICTFSTINVTCKQCTNRWYGGSKNELLAFGEVTSYASKYKSLLNSNEFILIIRNFGIEDINTSYTCAHGFDKVTKRLEMEDHYEYHPSDNDIHSTVSIDDFVLNIETKFIKVHPIPKCLVNLKNVQLTSNSNVTKNGLFKKVHVNVKHRLENGRCDGVLNMRCSFGSKEINPLKKDIGRMCKSQIENTDSDVGKDSTMFKIFGISSLICIFVILILTLVLRQRRRQKENNRQNKSTYAKDQPCAEPMVPKC